MVAAVVLFFFFFFFVLATSVNAAVIKHTFVVTQTSMKHLCKDTVVTVVNGQFPGPMVEATEGDLVVVDVVNKSPYGLTIHWHGVKQRLNCWADGAGMITQCPIHPNTTYTYRFDLTGHEGTLWWHSHVSSLRATLHGIIIIHPKSGSYPFQKPYKDVPIIIGEWWQKDLVKVEKNLLNGGSADDNPVAATINGKLGDLYQCFGVAEDNFVLDVEQGKTYLLRLVNAALFSEYYYKVAGHKLTVVGSDANYVRPYTTDVVAVAPGETVDVLLVADAPPCRYYMVAIANQPPKPDIQMPRLISRGLVQYKDIPLDASHGCSSSKDDRVVMPEITDQHDMVTTFYFHGNLTSLHDHHPLLPQVRGRVDERLFITLGKGSVCRGNRVSCKRGGSDESMEVAYMNNISFHLPEKTSLLEARYYQRKMDRKTDDAMVVVKEFPKNPPRVFDFTNPKLIPVVPGGKLEELEPTTKATTVRRFRYNTTVEVVFQSTAMMQSDSNPMHLHGHNMFVLAQGHGNYNAAKDVLGYNMVNPPLKNTVQVPRLGWAAVRFIADNPGTWLLHCHYEFHTAMGMASVFEVEDGLTLVTTLPPPTTDFVRCNTHRSKVAYE